MNIQKSVEEYIKEHPRIRDCLTNKLINYSSLARMISKELGISQKNFDAILIACRRHRDKIKDQNVFETRILELLKKTKAELKNKMMVAVLEKNINYNSLLELQKEVTSRKEEIHIIQGSN